MVTADHSTPCSLKTHSSDPVPVLVYGGEEENGKDQTTEFNEIQARKGDLGKMYGKELLKKVGFV